MLISIIALLIVNLLDCVLYSITVNKHGAQNNWWPLSGLYVFWKHRNKE